MFLLFVLLFFTMTEYATKQLIICLSEHIPHSRKEEICTIIENAFRQFESSHQTQFQQTINYKLDEIQRVVAIMVDPIGNALPTPRLRFVYEPNEIDNDNNSHIKTSRYELDYEMDNYYQSPCVDPHCNYCKQKLRTF